MNDSLVSDLGASEDRIVTFYSFTYEGRTVLFYSLFLIITVSIIICKY